MRNIRDIEYGGICFFILFVYSIYEQNVIDYQIFTISIFLYLLYVFGTFNIIFF